ncbi:MAG: DnaJ domain-containing protein [Alphaproteobacteria bacterium]|nr:DnaJ domain-containing protein [Alphaproteobacteria bacterium]
MQKRSKKYYVPQNEDTPHKCDHEGCEKAGEYKAPKDKKLKEYYWFCLEHVQEYNKKWNYYEGEIPEDKDKQKTRFYRRFKSKVRYQFGYDLWEESQFFADDYENEFDNSAQYSRDGIYFTVEEREYIKVLEMNIRDINPETLKNQYKKMAKKYHPDVNKDDGKAEEKFKSISEAYHNLKEKFERLPNYFYK